MFARLFTSRSLVAAASASVVAGGLFYGMNQTASMDAQTPLDPKEFKKFTIQSVQDISHDTKLFRFELPAGQSLNLPTASCIVTKAPIGADGKDVFRPYTPISSNAAKGYFEMMVKGYPAGVMSKHFMSLKAGDQVDIKGPIPKIAYSANMKRSLGMIAGGTGIAPMLQVLNAIVENPNDKTEVTVLFANRSVDDILLKSKLDAMAAKHANIKIHYLVDKAPASGALPGANFSVGYVTEDLLKKHLPAPSEQSMVFVCGPPPMMNAVSGGKAKDFSQGELTGMLAALGYNKDQVYKF